MWFESQNCAMMGLQATTGKRKLEAATAPSDSSPPKTGRWEADDCIARLQAVAVPSDTWRSPTPSLAATLLSSPDDYEDDDEFDDELSDDGIPEPARFHHHNHHHHHQTQQQQQQSSQQQFSNAPTNGANNHRYQQSTPATSTPTTTDYWQYYQPPQQQTIRCEENGKSYLELGASPPPMVRTSAASVRCCDGRTRWCHVPCYRQRRLAVLNLSMCKLARYRQCSDPSLRRSVLICNTLRRLEREMEAEPPEPASNNSYPPPNLPEMSSPSRPSPVVPESSPQPPPTATTTTNYEQSLREMTCSSGRATPFPSTHSNDNDSGLGDEDDDLVDERPINWGSVLSLTSQTDLESLNNNELYAELGLSSDPPDWNKELPASTSTMMRNENEWAAPDGFMHVLVGGT